MVFDTQIDVPLAELGIRGARPNDQQGCGLHASLVTTLRLAAFESSYQSLRELASGLPKSPRHVLDHGPASEDVALAREA